ncbi:MAG: hypothetical protein WBB23_06245 [Desulforhopalus sp.]
MATMHTPLTKEILKYRILISAPLWIPKIVNLVPELICLKGMKLLRRCLNGVCHLKLTVPVHAVHFCLKTRTDKQLVTFSFQKNLPKQKGRITNIIGNPAFTKTCNFPSRLRTGCLFRHRLVFLFQSI